LVKTSSRWQSSKFKSETDNSRNIERVQEIPMEDLKESGIGKAVMVLWKHPGETPHNKKLSKNLIEKWSRPIFGISSEYRDLGEEDEFNTKKKKETTKKDPTKSDVDLEIQLDKKAKIGKKLPQSPSFHARIPEKIAFDFKIRPKPQVNDSENQKHPATIKFKKIENRMAKLKSGSPKNVRASSMSIEGRNLAI